MRPSGFPFVVAIGTALLLLTALLWTLNADPATANSCGGGYHFHEPDTCHKHCKNGMSSHSSTHGENCSVSNPTPRPTRRPRRSATATPTPRPRPQSLVTPTPTPRPCPADVVGFAVDSVSGSSITMAWDTPQGSQPHGYKIESCNSAFPGCPGATVVATPVGSATTHTLTNLAANTSYHLRITALADPNSACSDSAASTIVTGSTTKIRLVVDNFRASEVTSTTVTLAWDAPASTTGLDRYRIEECNSADASCPGAREVATPAKTATTHKVTGLDPMVSYHYRITALAVANSNYLDSDPAASRGTTLNDTPAGIVDVTTLRPSVRGLSAVCSTADSATLTWRVPVSRSSLSGFKVEVLEDCADCSPEVFSVARTESSYTATGLSPNTVYRFTVYYRGTQFLSEGDNLDSERASVQCTTKIRLVVDNFRASEVTSTTATLAWDAPASTTGLDRYRIEECNSADASCPSARAVATPAKTATSHKVTGLDPMVTFHYRITALAVANSNYLDSDPAASRGTTPNDAPAGIVEVTTLRPSVRGLSATCEADSATLTWRVPVSRSSLSDFKVEVLEDCADCSPDVFSVARTESSYTVTGLSPNTVYHFTVYYRGFQFLSEADNLDSERASAQCSTTKKPLPVITGITVSSFTENGGVPLAWNTMIHSALDRYRIQVCSDAQCSASPTTYDTKQTAYSHICPRNSTCYYRVRAMATAASDYTDGPWSNFVIVSIPIE